MPVSGWNQCVKCVAPFSSAQPFIACATESASAVSSASPLASDVWRALKTCLGRRARCTSVLKTFAPKTWLPATVRSGEPSAPPLALHCAAVTFCCLDLLMVLLDGNVMTLAALRSPGLVRPDRPRRPSLSTADRENAPEEAAFRAQRSEKTRYPSKYSGNSNGCGRTLTLSDCSRWNST